MNTKWDGFFSRFLSGLTTRAEKYIQRKEHFRRVAVVVGDTGTSQAENSLTLLEPLANPNPKGLNPNLEPL